MNRLISKSKFTIVFASLLAVTMIAPFQLLAAPEENAAQTKPAPAKRTKKSNPQKQWQKDYKSWEWKFGAVTRGLAASGISVAYHFAEDFWLRHTTFGIVESDPNGNISGYYQGSLEAEFDIRRQSGGGGMFRYYYMLGGTYTLDNNYFFISGLSNGGQTSYAILGTGVGAEWIFGIGRLRTSIFVAFGFRGAVNIDTPDVYRVEPNATLGFNFYL